MSERIDPNYFGGIWSPLASVLRRTWLKQPAPSTKIDTTTLRTDLKAYLRGIWTGCPRKLALFTQAAQFHASSYPCFEVVGPFGNPWIRGNPATISIFFLTTFLRWM